MSKTLRIVAVFLFLSWSVAALAGGIFPSFTQLFQPSIGRTPLTTSYTAGSGGTTAGLLVKLDASGNVVTASTSDVGIIGIAISTVPAAASVEVATRGITTCVADNTTIIGDVLIPGTSTAGRCRDSAQSNNTLVANTTQVIGKALTVATVGNSVTLQLFGPGHYGASISASNAGTATALAANGANCSAGSYPLGVDASGAAESCTSAARTCNGVIYVSPTGSEALPSTQGNAAAIATAGLVRCSRVTVQCTKAATSLYWRVGVGAASQTCAVAIYDSTGATQIATSPESTTCATNNQNRSVTGLSYTLTAGTEYLACFANSGTTVQAVGNSVGTGTIGGISVATDTVVDGATAVGNKAQFNVDCTGSTTPYACCTGSGTGTCAGMPASLGTMTAPASTTFAFIVAE